MLDILNKHMLKKYHDVTTGRLILKILNVKINLNSFIKIDHIIINNIHYYNYTISLLIDIDPDYINHIKLGNLEAYFKDGFFHNENGYAYQNIDYKLYMLNGNILTKKEFQQKNRKVKLKNILI